MLVKGLNQATTWHYQEQRPNLDRIRGDLEKIAETQDIRSGVLKQMDQLEKQIEKLVQVAEELDRYTQEVESRLLALEKSGISTTLSPLSLPLPTSLPTPAPKPLAHIATIPASSSTLSNSSGVLKENVPIS